jgi:hypothetical protein
MHGATASVAAEVPTSYFYLNIVEDIPVYIYQVNFMYRLLSIENVILRLFLMIAQLLKRK